MISMNKYYSLLKQVKKIQDEMIKNGSRIEDLEIVLHESWKELLLFRNTFLNMKINYTKYTEYKNTAYIIDRKLFNSDPEYKPEINKSDDMNNVWFKYRNYYN